MAKGVIVKAKIGLIRQSRSVIFVILDDDPARTRTDPEAPVLANDVYVKDDNEIIRKKLKRLLKKGKT